MSNTVKMKINLVVDMQADEDMVLNCGLQYVEGYSMRIAEQIVAKVENYCFQKGYECNESDIAIEVSK